MKKEIYFDGKTIHTKEQFHQEFAKILSFPSYYKNDLDDLWTCLTSYIDPNIRLMITGFEHLLTVFSDERSGFQEIFERLELACPEMDLLISA